MTAQIETHPIQPVDDIDLLQEEIASLDLRLLAALSRRCEIAQRLGAVYGATDGRFNALGAEGPAFARALNRLAQ